MNDQYEALKVKEAYLREKIEINHLGFNTGDYIDKFCEILNSILVWNRASKFQ